MPKSSLPRMRYSRLRLNNVYVPISITSPGGPNRISGRGYFCGRIVTVIFLPISLLGLTYIDIKNIMVISLVTISGRKLS